MMVVPGAKLWNISHTQRLTAVTASIFIATIIIIRIIIIFDEIILKVLATHSSVVIVGSRGSLRWNLRAGPSLLLRHLRGLLLAGLGETASSIVVGIVRVCYLV